MSGGRRELLVLRHAKSAWNTPANTDFDRPLSTRGRRDCPRVAAWLADHDLVPDHVVASPAARAAETVERVTAELDLDAETILDFEPALYDASVLTLLAVLADVPARAKRVLVVAHNPGLDELVVHLAGRVPALSAGGKLMTTAAIASFALRADWSELTRGCGDLLRLVRPKEL